MPDPSVCPLICLTLPGHSACGTRSNYVKIVVLFLWLVSMAHQFQYFACNSHAVVTLRCLRNTKVPPVVFFHTKTHKVPIIPILIWMLQRTLIAIFVGLQINFGGGIPTFRSLKQDED